MIPTPSVSEETGSCPVPGSYGIKQVAGLLGLSAAQIRGYVSAGLVAPVRGVRGELQFSFGDLVLLRTVRELGDQLPARKVQRALARLRSQLPEGRQLTSVRITVEGDDVVVRDGAVAWDPDSGQVLFDFEVDQRVGETATPVTECMRVSGQSRAVRTPEEWYSLGCELEACEPERARRAYARALAADPTHVDAHLNLGRLCHEDGQLERAEHHYREALRCDPEEATAAFNLGVVLEDRDRLREALAAYERAIAADPDYADAHHNAAQLAEKMGRRRDALRHLQALRRLRDDKGTPF